MKIAQENNKVILEINENLGAMIAYFYLATLEFVSDGLFVPSLNPPENNDFMPSESFLNANHKLSYRRNATFSIKDNKIIIIFDTIQDAEMFKEDLERTW